jgi:predicted CDP-diglyceride synthetase/phosphatidate cytidylyltransferase
MFLLMIPLLAFYYLSAAIALANDKRRALRAKSKVQGTDLASDYKPDAVS